MNGRTKVLFVGKVNHRHTYRWISQFLDQNWNVLLFSSNPAKTPLDNFSDISIFPSLRLSFLWNIFNNFWPFYKSVLLIAVVLWFRPNILYSMDIQDTGPIVLPLKKILGRYFPKWIVSCWGSDIYLFGKFLRNVPLLKRVISSCDAFIADCQRDIDLARNFGLRDQRTAVFPTGGGYDIDSLRKRYYSDKPSKRNMILLKGNQGWAGRSLTGLAAMRMVAHQLSKYGIEEIVIYFAKEVEVVLAAELLALDTGLKVKILREYISHEEILKLMGKARISIGLSISDGTPNAMLESMIMGAFPIQSKTSAAGEWIKNGRTGLLVEPEDPCNISRAIIRALKNSEMIDFAEKENYKIVKQFVDSTYVTRQAQKFFREVCQSL